jgi:hypothetical protein
MSNPWKKNILDRSLDDLATDNQKYKKSGQYKKDLKQAAIAETKKQAAERRAKLEAEKEERIAASIVNAETSVNGSIDVTQFFDEEKVKALLGEFGTVEKCKVQFRGKYLTFNAKFEDKESAQKCLGAESLGLNVGELKATTTAPPIRGRNIYFKNPFTEEEQGDELNGKVKGLFESMSSDENKHVVTSVSVVNKQFSVGFESRDSVHAALKGFFEPLMLNNKKLGPVREGLPPKNVPVIQKKRKQQQQNSNRNSNNKKTPRGKKTPRNNNNNKRRRR